MGDSDGNAFAFAIVDAPRSPGRLAGVAALPAAASGARARRGGRVGLANHRTAALREPCGRRRADRGARDPVVGSDAADARPDRRGRRAPAELRHGHGRTGDRERAARRRRDPRRPVPRAFARRAHRGERPLLYARRSHHGGHEGLCRLRARLRRDRHRAAGSRRRRDAGQARPVRGCVRTVLPRLAGAREPVGCHAMERRFIERLRRRDGGGPVFRVGRNGHGRLDPVPVGRERMRGPQAHVRPREPLRRVRARPFHGPRRADDPHRGRRRHPVRSDGGRRSARPDVANRSCAAARPELRKGVAGLRSDSTVDMPPTTWMPTWPRRWTRCSRH